MNSKKLTLISLILMIFTSVFGFANIPRAFLKMGYASIPWYILSAITFFLPYAFMMAEFGAAYKDSKGGIYAWMANSIGPKMAFIGTFMWYTSYLIWMVSVSSSIWIPFSNAIWGADITPTWNFMGLKSTQVIGILGALWILFVTFFASRGLDKIKKITSIGGSAVALLNIVLLLGGIIILIANKGQLAEPIRGLSSFTSSPNVSNPGNIITIFAFLVYAVFAYGGTEAVGGLVDQTDDPIHTFPKGLTIAAFIIAIGYSLGIFTVGIFSNWDTVFNSENVHLGNAAYVTMANLGYMLGSSLGATESVSVEIGRWFSRFSGLSMFLALSGAFFTLIYSPLKQLIEGTPAKIWPGKLSKITDDMPQYAMWIQGFVVIAIILLVSFGGENAEAFFDKLTLMTNVAMTIPYMFLSIAYWFFKNNPNIEKPFELFRGKALVTFITIIVTFTVGFANFFTIIEPSLNGNLSSTIWSIVGPVFFSIIALLLYSRYERISSSEVK